MTVQQQKCQAFADLHQQPGAFLIPNPWDVGSATLLQALGFKALATTSAGLAYTLGRSDGEVTLAEKLTHCAALAAGTHIPVNADFENGFADQPEAVAENVRRVIETGVAGCSIEDFSRDTHTLYDATHAVERIQAAVEAVRGCGMPFQLTARAENLLRGVNDLDDTISRLKSFEAAGADVVYAPGIKSLDQLRGVTAELKTPFNVLAPFFRGVSVDQLAAAGAKRISVGGALNWAAVNPVLIAGEEMLNQGTFGWLDSMAPRSRLAELLG
ncbi:MAG: isocitrate lyase/phosphoenolpyruvate mutase family protein [Proteobacteria bacterium]|nr:isocitrate lyase/phosphoenolpyruvate mutase family protein [Pseudomonadota bacterium]